MAVGYFLLSFAGLALVDDATHTAAIWPATGLAFSAFVVIDRSWWPWLTAGVFTGNIVAQAVTYGLSPMVLGLAAANAAEVVLASAVFLAVAGTAAYAFVPRTVRALMTAAAVPALTALVGAISLAIGNDADFGRAYIQWVIADAVSILALGPIALLALDRDQGAPAGLAERIATFAVSAAVTWGVFTQGPDGIDVLRYSFLVLPFALVPALRLPVRLVVLNLAVIVTIVALSTARGTGPFSREELTSVQEMLVAQAFIAVLVVCTLLAAAVVRRARENEARYRFVADHTHDLISVHALDGTASYISPSASRVLGIAPEQAVGTWAGDRCHPDDRERVRRAFEFAATGEDEVIIAYRVVRENEWRWLESNLSPMRTADGEVLAIVASSRDITARIDAQVALRTSERLHRLVLDHLPEAIVTVYDDQLRILAVHGGELSDRGLDPSEVVGKRLEEASPGDAEILAPELLRALQGEERTFEAQASVTGRIYEVSLAPFRDDEGYVAGVISVSRDVTLRHQQDQELRHLADHDPLTSLPNRRRFDTELGRHVARLQRYGPQGSVLLVDLDRFKTINDTLGHAAGDEFIVRAARLLRSETRESDVVARIGGDEFAILLPKGGPAEAAETANRLVEAVHEASRHLGEDEPVMTFSIGAASFAQEGTSDPDAIVAAADRAMYAAKDAGRDGYVVSTGPRAA